MIKFKISLLAALLFISCYSVKAQSEVKEYSIKKGQVFDIIFLTNRTEPEVNSLLQDYFKRAFPIAEAHGFHSLKGHGIKENAMGNYLPSSMIFGYWDSLEEREKFLEVIDTQMPDFHEMRRKIWSTFDLTYYEMAEDLNFQIDRSNYVSVTAYWKKDDSFGQFKKAWLEESAKAGGETKVVFTNGQSPFGYLYSPDFLAITEWKTEETFKEFHKENIQMDHSSVVHVNQFILK